MPNITCQECGGDFAVTPHVLSETCPDCGTLNDCAAWRPLWAITEVQDRIRRERNLPADLRAELLDRTEQRRQLLEARLLRPLAERPASPATAAPPPLPPEARTRVRTSGAPSPAATRPDARALARGRQEKAREERKRIDAELRAARGPTVWERLGPAAAENLGFALASFLIVAGAIYFATTAWTTMTGEERLLVVTGGLVLLGGVLFAAGRLLNRGGTLPEVERVLLLVCCLLVPVAAVPAGNLLALSLALGLVAAFFVVGPGFITARALGRNLDAALWPFLAIAFTVLAALPLAGPVVGKTPLLATGIAAALLVLSSLAYARLVVPRAAKTTATLLWPPLLLAFAALVFAGRTAISAAWLQADPGRIFASAGIVIAAVGVSLVLTERALAARGHFGSGRSAVLLVIAMALGVTGTVFALGDDVGLALAAAIGAWAAIRAGFALPVPWLALPGLVLSALAYLRSPAPVREAMLRLRDQAAAALGYVDEPLPLAWYGLTFLPYVAACGVAGWWLRRRGRRGESTVLLTWTFVIAAGLTTLSLLTSGNPPGSDLRAPAAVLGAQGALLFALGWATRHRWLLFTGALGMYGGATCAALHRADDPATVLLALALLGLAGMAIGGLLGRRGQRPPARRAQAALYDATACLALGLVAFALIDMLGGTPTYAWHGLAFVALSALFAVLGFAYRRPEGILLASLALAGAPDRVLDAWVPEGLPGYHVLFTAALSVLPLLAGPIGRRFPVRIRHPFWKSDLDPGAWAPAGTLLLLVAGWNLFFSSAARTELTWSWPLAGGLGLGAAVLVLAAVTYRQRWPLLAAALVLTASAIAVTGVLGEVVYGSAGLMAVAVVIALTSLPIATHRPKRIAALAQPELAILLSLGTVLFVGWAALLVLLHYGRPPLPWDGWQLAGASLLVAMATRLVFGRRGHVWDAETAAVAAGLLFGVAAVGILDALGARIDVFPLGLLAASVVAVFWAGGVPSLQVAAGVHAVAALALATALALSNVGDPLLLLVSFGAIAAAGRIAARRAPIAGGVLMLSALLGGISLVLLVYFWPVHWTRQAAVWIAFAAATLGAWRVPVLGVSRPAARLVAWPILGVAYVSGVATALWVAIAEPAVSTDSEFLLVLGGARWAAGALIVASIVFSLGRKTALRRAAPVGAAALAAFVYAPLNVLLQGSADHLWRPDLEVGLLAGVLALVLPPAPVYKRRPTNAEPSALGGPGRWPLALAALALVLTVAALRNPSTPLTVLAATMATFALVVRDRRRHLGHLFGAGVVATGFAFVAWLRPTEGPLAEELVLLFAATAALATPLLWGIAAALRSSAAGTWRALLALELPGTAILSAAAAFAGAAIDTVMYAGIPAGGPTLAFAAIAYGIPGFGAAWGARRLDRPYLIHLAVASFLGLYAFAAQRTELLAFLDGYHLHVLIGVGGALLLLSELKRDRTAQLLAIDGVLLAVPAIFAYAPRAFFGTLDDNGAVSALALSAVLCTYAARRLAWPALYWVAVGLVNLMLYAFWRRSGIVDPAFYGIPPGLSLVAGAVALRGRVPRQTRLALLVPGLALLYGSVAIQVLQVGNPVHALLLFAMGLVTVALGFRFHQNAWLITGMTVVVLDVIAYLASHGFETGFFGAALLIAAGLSVFAVAALATKRRRGAAAAAAAEASDETNDVAS